MMTDEAELELDRQAIAARLASVRERTELLIFVTPKILRGANLDLP